MLPVSFAAIFFTLSLSVFLGSSFNSFKTYNHRIQDFSNWQETSLAAAKRVSIESSDLIADLKEELDSCLTQYSAIKTDDARAGFRCQANFNSDVQDFKMSLKANYNNQLNTSIKYGLALNEAGPSYKSYDYKLYHSDKLPSAFEIGEKLYNSTIVSESDMAGEVNINDFDFYVRDQILNINSGFLKTLIGQKNFDIVAANPA